MMKAPVTLLISTALLFAAPAFAVDGVVLINQATVMAAGGFPYVINQPGSYKLSGNLVVAVNVDGIEISADNVSIDLNGFTISGPVTCTGSGTTISCTAGSGVGINQRSGKNASVRNGAITGFWQGMASSGVVEEIRASGNSAWGIIAPKSLVRRNVASGNGIGGIDAFESTVTENVADTNGSYGLAIGGGVYGSNALDGNGSASVVGGGVSQNNNDCNGSVC